MIYYKLPSCYMAPLSIGSSSVYLYTKFVNEQLTTEFLHAGTEPILEAEVAKRWAEEKAAGDILFSVFSLSGTEIGTVGLHQFRWVYRHAEQRFLIFDPEYVGKGLGQQLCRMLLWHGFQRLNLNRQWLGVSSKNTRAISCYKKCGFVEEGRLRQELYVMGEYTDAIRMSVLRSEWDGKDPREQT